MGFSSALELAACRSLFSGPSPGPRAAHQGSLSVLDLFQRPPALLFFLTNTPHPHPQKRKTWECNTSITTPTPAGCCGPRPRSRTSVHKRVVLERDFAGDGSRPASQPSAHTWDGQKGRSAAPAPPEAAAGPGTGIFPLGKVAPCLLLDRGRSGPVSALAHSPPRLQDNPVGRGLAGFGGAT